MPNGSLEDILGRSRKSATKHFLNNSQKYIILLGIALGMKYLHSIGVIHRDLKPDNILLDENFYPKICDFGISFISDLQLSKIIMEDTLGTPMYMAPEIIEDLPYTYKVDVYSFALLMYELISEQKIFNCYSKKSEVFKAIINGERPDLSFIMNERIETLIKKCWDQDPLKRPSFNEIVHELYQLRYDNFFEADQNQVDAYLEIFDDDLKNINRRMALNVKFAAEHGDFKAIKYYIFMNYFGRGVPINKKEAARFLKILADGGHVDSMNNYGNILSLGDGIEINKQEAAKYFKMAADKGNEIGMFNYSLALENGDGIEVNKFEAADYYKKAAKKGHDSAMNNYGNMLFHGKGVDINYKKAAKYHKMSADKGNAIGMINYANALKNGIGVNIDKNEAAKYYKMAADKGNDKAMFLYAFMLFDGNGIDENKKKAAKYFKLSASKGNNGAMFLYGLMLYQGNGINKHKKKAATFFQMASDKGNTNAMLYLANMFSTGDGVKKDPVKSAGYYKMAADNGSIEGMLKYGDILNQGIEIEKNQKEAAFYYKKAADLDVPVAMYKYGVMLYLGYEKTKKQKKKIKTNDSVKYQYRLFINKKEAAKYFELAANYNDHRSMLLYGKMLLFGDGIPVDRKKGAHFIKLSVDLGNDMSMLIMSFILGYKKVLKLTLIDNPNEIVSSEEEIFLLVLSIGLETLSNNNGFINKEILARLRKILKNKGISGLYGFFESIFDGTEIPENEKKAIWYLKKSAEKKNIYSILLYNALILSDMISGDKNDAMNNIKMEANKENYIALFVCGILLLDENSIFYNKDEGKKYLKISANKGNSIAMVLYGSFMIFDDEEYNSNKNDINEGIEYIKMATSYANNFAMFIYGMLLYDGEIIPIDKKRGIRYIEKAANAGNKQAMIFYAMILFDGDGCRKNVQKALFYFNTASQELEENIIYNKITEILIGKTRNGKSNLLAKNIKKLSSQKNANAMYLYGEMLFYGNGIKENKKEAIKYLKMSADLGNCKAMLKYGRLLFNGKYIKQNKKEAMDYLKKAANKDDKAMYLYGKMLIYKRSFKSFIFNKREGINYLEKAAKSNNVDAMYEYGVMLYEGDGIPKDKQMAIKYIKKSADGGNKNAMCSYGNILIKGDGMMCNKNEGYRYLKNGKNIGGKDIIQANKREKLIIFIITFIMKVFLSFTIRSKLYIDVSTISKIFIFLESFISVLVINKLFGFRPEEYFSGLKKEISNLHCLKHLLKIQ